MSTTQQYYVDCGCSNCIGGCRQCSGSASSSVTGRIPATLHATFYNRRWGSGYPWLDGLGNADEQWIWTYNLATFTGVGSVTSIPTPPPYDPYLPGTSGLSYYGFLEPTSVLLKYHPNWRVVDPLTGLTLKYGAWVYQSFVETGYFCINVVLYCYGGQFHLYIWYLEDADGLLVSDTGTSTGSSDGDPLGLPLTNGVKAILKSSISMGDFVGWLTPLAEDPNSTNGFGDYTYTQDRNDCGPVGLIFGSAETSAPIGTHTQHTTQMHYTVPTSGYAQRFVNLLGADPAVGPDQTGSGNTNFGQLYAQVHLLTAFVSE